MARLCNLKPADSSIDLALSMGKFSKDYLREIEIQKILAAFPKPLIELFKLPVDKDFVVAASPGDFLLYAATGNPYVLGGFATGSVFGIGYAILGWGYPFVFSLLAVLIFSLADALTTRIGVPQFDRSENKWVPCLSSMVIVSFFTWFFYLTSAATAAESISI